MAFDVLLLQRPHVLEKPLTVVSIHLPEKIRDYKSSDLSIPGVAAHEMLTMDEVERRYVLRVLQQLNGNKTLAADLLGVDRRTLYRKMERWGQSSASESVD